SQAWKFSREKFIRNDTEDCLANLCDATKGFSRRLAFGRSNGRLRECSRTRQRVSTCIRPAFLRTQRRKNGTADYSFGSRRVIRCVATMMRDRKSVVLGKVGRGRR